ncbi:two-component system response regulator YesN [Paenibacillus castaneae]|uniref:response regulator transcription factor n=1 Tax=Paenibacillus castaneae TaxID=474957 RepID=UPI000C9A1768|nr:response regulator [Paenibacillus castaneae]NIK76570.1 two-component system response regulator YesN [Paenibacillus castaneae]
MKLKVMLVDDELLVRLGVKSLIDWEKHNFEFIGDASDGEKALELMENRVPDILLTDIVMPRMNGLQLIEIVKQKYPNMLIIVLSSHNEFEYVRKAMKLGVEDYLLKTSMKPAELLDLLIEAAGKISGGQAQHTVQTDQAEQQDTRIDALTRQLELRLQGESIAASEMLELRPNSILLVLHVRHVREGGMEPSSIELLKHLIQSELDTILDSNPVSVGNREMVVLLTISEDKNSQLEMAINNLISTSSHLLGISLRAEVSGSLHDWEEVRSFYLKAKSLIIDQGVRETTRDDIKLLLDYMSANFTHDISLKDAAEMINMSESYLSTIFKKETGLGFTDWINLLRIDHAARFLVDTNLPSYLIAEQVGYENINYFGRIFKKFKGVSPQKYRAQYQKKTL